MMSWVFLLCACMAYTSALKGKRTHVMTLSLPGVDIALGSLILIFTRTFYATGSDWGRRGVEAGGVASGVGSC